MTGFRVGLRGAQGVLGVTPDLTVLGKVDRRRHAAGGLRRSARDHGAAGAAGPGLPGRHPVGQPGGHGLRARHPQGRSPSPASTKRCRRKTRSLVDGLKAAAAAGGRALQRRQRRRHVRLLPARRAAAELHGGDEERRREVQPAVPRPAGARRLHRAGALRGRLRERRAQRRRHRRQRSRRRARSSRRCSRRT